MRHTPNENKMSCRYRERARLRVKTVEVMGKKEAVRRVAVSSIAWLGLPWTRWLGLCDSLGGSKPSISAASVASTRSEPPNQYFTSPTEPANVAFQAAFCLESPPRRRGPVGTGSDVLPIAQDSVPSHLELQLLVRGQLLAERAAMQHAR